MRVTYEKAGRLVYVTLDRPEALNALDDEFNDELARVWAEFEADDGVDVAIVTGAGKAFCAGADLKSFVPRWKGASMLDARRAVARGIGGGITRGRHRIYKPLIAAVNGYALGAGFELALACDIRVASTDAKFGVFEVRHGLHQGDGGLVRLMLIGGVGLALELTLTGREVPADEALRLGLVSVVVEPQDLLATAERYAQHILRNDQRAIRSAKETVMDLVGRSLDDALRLETLNAYSCLGDASRRGERTTLLERTSRQ